MCQKCLLEGIIIFSTPPSVCITLGELLFYNKEEIVILDIRGIVAVFFQILYYLILARIILSFFPINPYSSSPVLINIVQFVRQVTEPLLAPFRSLVPPMRMGAGYLDLSPILAIVVLSIVRNMLLRFL